MTDESEGPYAPPASRRRRRGGTRSARKRFRSAPLAWQLPLLALGLSVFARHLGWLETASLLGLGLLGVTFGLLLLLGALFTVLCLFFVKRPWVLLHLILGLMINCPLDYLFYQGFRRGMERAQGDDVEAMEAE